MVLVVEDDPLIHHMLSDALVDGGFRVAGINSG
jgi:DNA-binding response OmpR family regulator